jgi:PAS domain S-box-containing protein
MSKTKGTYRAGILLYANSQGREIEMGRDFVDFLLSLGVDVDILLVFRPEHQRNEVFFDPLVKRARHERWACVFLGPQLRVAELPWVEKGNLEDLQLFFLRPGNRQPETFLDEVESFFAARKPRRRSREAELHVSVVRDFSVSSLAHEAWLVLSGKTELLEKVPFLIDYLNLPSQASAQEPPEIQIIQLRNALFEKDVSIRRLQHNEKRYRKFFEDDITGDFLMDLNWRLLDCNRTFSRIFGFPSLDYALGYDVKLLFPSREERSKTVETFLRLLALDYYELELVRPDGHPVNIIANVVGIRGENGRLSQVRGFLFDNTPRKNLEKQLRESQKMEGLGRLAGGVAHDFNNLLTVINGYSELLLADLPPDAPLAAELGEILHAGLKAADLTRQLLAFSRRQVLTPQVIDLNQVVRKMETMLQRLMTERVRLFLHTETEAARLKADKGQIEQVILNLVLNARDAMPDGGQLIVRTSSVFIESSVYDSLDFILPGNYVCLEVADTGVGMDEEVRKRIFEPFFTTKAQGKGTGLGLATVYGIVQQSGGYLKLESEPGRGSRFLLYFDSYNEADTEEPIHEAFLPVPKGSSERIALVEDEEMVREYTKRILTRYGYRVQAFSDGSLALKALGSNPGSVDLILTDIVMPTMTGPELIRKLSETGIDIPFVYMSGYTDDEIIRHGVSSNQVMFLHKPFKSKDLLEKIKQALDQRKESRR